MRLAAEYGIDPALMRRITAISSGTLDALPHNGTVLLLLQISGLTHRESYRAMVMTVIIALVVVLVRGSVFGSF
jgi:H+/gluconate symporter-like permease